MSTTHHGAVTAKRESSLFQPTLPQLTHSSSLAPKYEELGRLFTPFNSQVTIAKVDATLNDVPEEIAGFPTIKLYPAGAKDAAVDYTGSRTVEDLVAFIRDNGHHKIDAYADDDAELSNVSSILTKATETMQHQAATATASASSAASAASGSASSAASAASGSAGSAASAASEGVESATEAVAEATESAKAGIVDGVKNVIDAVTGGDDSMDDHDEL